MKTITAVDLFAGAGGTSTGLVQACEALGLKLKLTAINHWERAIETHSQNHPTHNHLCEHIDRIDPRKLIRNDLDVLVASPECTHHSIARGGMPCSDQSRATAWHVLRWTEALRPRYILVENVKEFRDWGPLDVKGRPMKSRKGELFKLFIDGLQKLGYRVSINVVNCANYGDPTTRERLFVMARRDRIPRLPSYSHAEDPGVGQKLWVPASEVIDWSVEAPSIFGRKKDLAEKTQARIARGIQKFVMDSADPFIIPIDYHGGNGKSGRSVQNPLTTITTKARHCLVLPHVQKYFGGVTGRPVTDPLSTVTTKDHQALCAVWLNRFFGSATGRSLDKPCPTILTSPGHTALSTAYLTRFNAGENRNHGVDDPLPTVDTSNRYALINAYLIKYFGTGSNTAGIHSPLGTVTTKDRFGLVTIHGEQYFISDIGLRMLQPHELAAAQGFPTGYIFTGNKAEQVKQIGNAVPVGTATSLLTAFLRKAAA